MRPERSARLRAGPLAAAALLSLVAIAPPTAAQSTPPNFLEEFEGQFGASASKLVSLARAMPESTYGWSPGEGVYTVARVYTHIARYNYMYPSENLGRHSPVSAAEYGRWEEEVTDKDEVVAILERSMQYVRQVTAETDAARLGDPTRLYGREVGEWAVLLQLVTHMNEHLGQAIAYARMNGVVPPWSRGAPSPAGTPASGVDGLISLWSEGLPAFGVFAPNEREPGATGPDGERLGPLHTVGGGALLAADPLLDYVFLNLERSYDAEAVAAIAEGLRGDGARNAKALLVRIPPISRDGEDAARARVVESLALGADGVVLPHVRDPEEARVAVSFFEGADVWTPQNPDGRVLAMLMIEDAGALAAVREIADTPGFSVLACGIGSLTGDLGDREAAEEGNQEVLRHAKRVGLPDMITANDGDVARRIEEGFLGLLMNGPRADDHIRVGRAAAGR